ncbi:hypothetical protein ElyMa_004593300 [Elysia marginata]|uniref:Uncharacterized protein n=1 Tax=Elysia marginata TaxID=1093978 RepID=A0AAV4HWN3_9GAST|nr:hypothetical protein ElyMa_004593300 [Elysia marginata]
MNFRAGEECNILCFGVGEAISDIGVVKLLPDGSQEAVPSADKAEIGNTHDHFRTIMWKFQAGNGSRNNEGITTFQCTAYDETNGKEVSCLVDVVVLLEDGFDEERSNVTIEEEYMEPSIKIVTFNCAVYGRPIPEVTFTSGTSYIFNMDSYEPDTLIRTGPDRAVATKTLLLDLEHLRDYGYRLYDEDTMPSCEFRSAFHGRYLEHTFEIPDLGLEI